MHECFCPSYTGATAYITAPRMTVDLVPLRTGPGMSGEWQGATVRQESWNSKPRRAHVIDGIVAESCAKPQR